MGRRPDINGRELLIHAALKLFANEGIEGVSIRAVNREAGLGPASMHYHFGTKDALVEAVLHMHGDTIVEAMRTRATELLETQSSVGARDLVTMYSQPYLDLIAAEPDTGHNWVKLVSQLQRTDPEQITDTATTKLIRSVAAKAYPDASTAQIDRAMKMLFLLLVTQLAQMPPRTRGRNVSTVDLDLLIDFLSGGLDNALRTDAPAARMSVEA